MQWWPNGDSNNEGTQLNLLFSMCIQCNGGLNGDSNNEGTQLNLLFSMRIQYNGGPMVIAIMKELS